MEELFPPKSELTDKIWGWSLDTLALAEEANLHLLNGLVQCAPEFEKDEYFNARERIAMRSLVELLNPETEDDRFRLWRSHASPYALDLPVCCEASVTRLFYKATRFPYVKEGSETAIKKLNEAVCQKAMCLPQPILNKLKDALDKGKFPSMSPEQRNRNDVEGSHLGIQNWNNHETNSQDNVEESREGSQNQNNNDKISEDNVEESREGSQNQNDNEKNSEDNVEESCGGSQNRDNDGNGSEDNEKASREGSQNRNNDKNGSDDTHPPAKRFRVGTLHDHTQFLMENDGSCSLNRPVIHDGQPSHQQDVHGVLGNETEFSDENIDNSEGKVLMQEQSTNAGDARGNPKEQPSSCQQILCGVLDSEAAHSRMEVEKGESNLEMQEQPTSLDAANNIVPEASGNQNRESSSDDHNKNDGGDQAPTSVQIIATEGENPQGNTRRCEDAIQSGPSINVQHETDTASSASYYSVGHITHGGHTINSNLQKLRESLLSFSMGIDSLPGNCVKCNGSGPLLTCEADDCFIAVHEACLASDAKFNDAGKFQCPYCVHKQAFIAYREAKKRVLEAKEGILNARKSLASFVGSGDQLHEHKSNEIRANSPARQRAQEEEGTSQKHDVDIAPAARHTYEEEGTSENLNLLRDSEKPAETLQLQVAILRNDCVSTDNQNAEVNLPPFVADAHHLTHGSCVPGPSHEMDQTGGIQKEISIDSISTGDSMRIELPPYQPQPQPSPIKRKSSPKVTRRRHKWTQEEEEALKEAIRVHPPVLGIIRWQKILEHGRSVFHENRTTEDLRFKWRRMQR